jgi:hypothetical protein
VIRPFAIVLLGLSLVGCGVRIAPPTQQEVWHKDVVGTTWQYRGTAPATNCEITFNADGTYTLVRRLSGSTLTNTGWWGLSGAHLNLAPFDTFSPTGQGAIERHRLVRWWFTDVSTNQVVLFGGDSLDPHRWAVLSRVGGEPAVRTDIGKPPRPLPVGIAPARPGGDDLTRTIGFSVVAGLAVCLAVSIGLRLWRALPRPRPGKQKWSSGSSAASAILPRIQRLRGSHLSVAPVPARQTPAHNWLIATARRVLAHLTYFRKRENPEPTAFDEKPHDDA